jgi:signal transduction histidine kinase
MERESAALIVKIISILGYIGAVISVIFGIMFLFGGPVVAGMFESRLGLASGIVGGLMIMFGILLVIGGVIWFWLAYELMKHKNWARIVVIVLSAIGFIGAIFSLPASIISLIINGLMIYLLAFNADIVALFTGKIVKAPAAKKKKR